MNRSSMNSSVINSLKVPIRWEIVGGFRIAVWPKLEQAGIETLTACVSKAAQIHAAKIGHLSRRQEWLAARVLSRELTKQEPSTGTLGNPLWENGWQGSISHKNGHVAMWCADQSATTCGVDLELVRELSPGATAKIMNSDETKICDERLAKVGTSLIFGAKEAIYKALFPKVNRFFYFDAVALIELSGGGNSYELSFTVLDALKAPELTGTRIRVSAKKIDLAGEGRLVPEGQADRSDAVPAEYWLVVASLPLGCHP